jgi:hypothetical protein
MEISVLLSTFRFDRGDNNVLMTAVNGGEVLPSALLATTFIVYSVLDCNPVML